MIYFCCNQKRLNALKQKSQGNGIDSVAITRLSLDPIGSQPAPTHNLRIVFFNSTGVDQLSSENFRFSAISAPNSPSPFIRIIPPGISEDVSITLSVWVSPEVITNNNTFLLQLIDPNRGDALPSGFNQTLSEIQFSFNQTAASQDADKIINGIEYLEVKDLALGLLHVHFVSSIHLEELTSSNIRIEGGERIRDVQVSKVSLVSGQPSVLEIEVNQPGDFSTYVLRVVTALNDPTPKSRFDPILSAIDFSFKVDCPSDFDCRTEQVCPPEPLPQPEINYLAKDYASFRQLMLDRLSTLLPNWRERHAADQGIALIELLAYVGDYLSYQQDAVATEAYLGTARRRTSIKRHARLVDYQMHEGCNARTWVRVQVKADKLLPAPPPNVNDPKLEPIRFLTAVSGASDNTPSAKLEEFLSQVPAIFELKYFEKSSENINEPEKLPYDLYAAHNEMYFHTWGDMNCCLPKGATRATLRNDKNELQLKAGDVLVLAELLGPDSGDNADANLSHRHAVRLTAVKPSEDPLDHPQNPLPVVEIEWHEEDALPFPLCISSTRKKDDGSILTYENVSVVWGNIVMADHGWTVEDKNEEGKEKVISLVPAQVPKTDETKSKLRPNQYSRCEQKQGEQVPPRYRPYLKNAPLTFAVPLSTESISGSAAMRYVASEAMPVINLNEKEWEPRRDLILSDADHQHFVVETENDGTAFLRFGDDVYGKRPTENTQFLATYRIGNGSAGNIGAESLVHISCPDDIGSAIKSVTNPLPASGGVDPESLEQVRQFAPEAFRVQERAVTLEDYEMMAKRVDPSVQRAAATSRWTGSWHTTFLSVDRLGGGAIDDDFEVGLRNKLERYRLAGHDLEIDTPRYVALEIELLVCVKPGYQGSDIKRALLDVFTNRVLRDGRRGVFHPDNFTFGQPVYLSRIISAAQAVEGVNSVEVRKFQRWKNDRADARDSGILPISRLEIARLDNNPNFPEHGTFKIITRGGR